MGSKAGKFPRELSIRENPFELIPLFYDSLTVETLTLLLYFIAVDRPAIQSKTKTIRHLSEKVKLFSPSVSDSLSETNAVLKYEFREEFQ